jgi:putative NADPH-quinone reductase
MTRRILIINGNPARQRRSFSEALAQAYHEGAISALHQVREVKLADLQFDPILHEGYHGHQFLEPHLTEVQDSIRWAEQIVFIYPMWQFGVPALVKGFCERVFTPGFAYELSAENPMNAALLKGKSVRLIQTMGMPGAFYSLVFRAHGGKAFQSLFRFCGFDPVRLTIMGMVEGEKSREAHLSRCRALGARGI